MISSAVRGSRIGRAEQCRAISSSSSASRLFARARRTRCRSLELRDVGQRPWGERLQLARRCSGFQILTRDSAHRRMGGTIGIQLLLIAHAIFAELSDLDLELARALGQLRHVENGVGSVVRRVVAGDGLD